MYSRKKIHETCPRNGKYLQRQSWDCLRQYNDGWYLEKVVQRPVSSFKWWKAIECTCNNWCMTEVVFFSIDVSKVLRSERSGFCLITEADYSKMYCQGFTYLGQILKCFLIILRPNRKYSVISNNIPQFWPAGQNWDLGYFISLST